MKIILHISIVLILFGSCKKEISPNPFDEEIVNQDTVRLKIINPEPNSIAGIYQNVFKPTCSNIGCHDGTFDPDFRTMESSYNTLLFQTPIKNNGNYTYRVDPYNAEKSVIMGRLDDLLGPFMPIQIEPDSDWPQKGKEYIENIRSWISNGAPDIAGVVRTIPYPTPSLAGAVAFSNDTILKRINISGPIFVPDSVEKINFFFSFKHEDIDPIDLKINKIAFSSDPENFDSTTMYNLSVINPPIRERGYDGMYTEFTHKIEMNPAITQDSTINQWYFRVYVQDDKNPITEIPNNNGIYYIKNYMSFKKAE